MEKLIYNVRQIFGEYLTSKGCSFYNIPEYQRGYKWTAANVIQLLEDFLSADYDISFSGKSIYNHNCGNDINEELNFTRRKIIENYITLLKWVLAGCIDNNTNKIKVIGEKFGELLPLLQF
jgi:hypothetical protein